MLSSYSAAIVFFGLNGGLYHGILIRPATVLPVEVLRLAEYFEGRRRA